MDLNAMQQKVVSSTDGPLLVLAGAGSGKTAVLVERTKAIMSQGIKEENICIITFTNKAAYEISERIKKATHHTHKILVGTFHSIALSLIREEINFSRYMSGFEILSEYDMGKIIGSCIKRLGFDLNLNDCIRQISRYKYSGISPDQVNNEDERIVKIYHEYQRLLQQYNRIDFDEIILESIRILKEPEVYGRWSNKIRYLMVDEFQDTNIAQYKFLKALFKESNSNLCVVGDDYQSIYGFRGADINIILNFQKDYKAKVIKLEENYRSTKNIVQASKAIITNNTKQAKKDVFTSKDKGSLVFINKFETSEEEAEFIVNTIIKKTECEKARYKDFAILFRANKFLDGIKLALENAGIPYKTLEKWEKPLSVESISIDITELQEQEENTDSVTLLTVHSSKGLEFTNVFLIAVEQGSFPSRYMTKGDLLEEERRVMYVAMTRAKETLYISYTNTRTVQDKQINNKASQFITEIPKCYVQYNTLAELDFRDVIEKVKILSKHSIEHPQLGQGRVIQLITLDDKMKSKIEVDFGHCTKILEVQF